MIRHLSRFPAPPPPPAFGPFDGLLLVDKPAGPTSHDVVYKIRKTFAIDKVGHGGTLDPGATGLLLILLGKATKLSDRIMGGDKTYTGILRLGAATDTQDDEGDVTARGDPSGVTPEALDATLHSLTGDIYQTPPMVSAVKKNGIPLYKIARSGAEIERDTRFVHIYEFVATAPLSPASEAEADSSFPAMRTVPIRVRCTKGVYIRTLCHDVGEALGCHGHLSGLRRLRSGRFDVADATPLDALLAMTRDELARHIVPMLRLQGSLA